MGGDFRVRTVAISWEAPVRQRFIGVLGRLLAWRRHAVAAVVVAGRLA